MNEILPVKVADPDSGGSAFFWKLGPDPDRIRIRVKNWTWIRIRIKIKIHWRSGGSKMEHWRVYRPVWSPIPIL